MNQQPTHPWEVHTPGKSQGHGASTSPYRLNEKAEAEACELLAHLEQLAVYAKAHPSCKITIAKALFQTVLGERVLREFRDATGLELTIYDPEEAKG